MPHLPQLVAGAITDMTPLPQLVADAIVNVFPWASTDWTPSSNPEQYAEAYIGDCRRIKVHCTQTLPDLLPVEFQGRFLYVVNRDPIVAGEDPYETAEVLLEESFKGEPQGFNHCLLGFLSWARMEWNEATYRTVPQRNTCIICGEVFLQANDGGPNGREPTALQSKVDGSILRQVQTNGRGPWTWMWSDPQRDLNGGPDGYCTAEGAVKAWIKLKTRGVRPSLQGLSHRPARFRSGRRRG